MKERIVFFGYNRKPKEYAHIPYVTGKAFIAMHGDAGAAREDLFMAIEGRNLVVAILSTADLGRGAAIPKFFEEVEKRGSTVRVYEQSAVAKKKHPVSDKKLNLTPEQTDTVCGIWGRSYLTEADRLAQINALDGVPLMNKAQVYYTCRTKPKREAAKSTDKR